MGFCPSLLRSTTLTHVLHTFAPLAKTSPQPKCPWLFIVLMFKTHFFLILTVFRGPLVTFRGQLNIFLIFLTWVFDVELDVLKVEVEVELELKLEDDSTVEVEVEVQLEESTA